LCCLTGPGFPSIFIEWQQRQCQSRTPNAHPPPNLCCSNPSDNNLLLREASLPQMCSKISGSSTSLTSVRGILISHPIKKMKDEPQTCIAVGQFSQTRQEGGITILCIHSPYCTGYIRDLELGHDTGDERIPSAKRRRNGGRVIGIIFNQHGNGRYSAVPKSPTKQRSRTRPPCKV